MSVPTISHRAAWMWITLAPQVGAQTVVAPTGMQPPATTTPASVAAVPATTVSPPPTPTASPSPTVPPGLPPAPAGYRYVRLRTTTAPAYQPAPELPYEEGDPIPIGYRLREEPRRGLVVGGYVLTAIPYGIGVMIALSADFKNQTGYLLLPVVGPWLTIGRRSYFSCHNDRDSSENLGCVADIFVVLGLAMDGLMQAGGGAMLLTGYLATTKKLVRNDVALTLRPQVIGTGYGLGASGTF